MTKKFEVPPHLDALNKKAFAAKNTSNPKAGFVNKFVHFFTRIPTAQQIHNSNVVVVLILFGALIGLFSYLGVFSPPNSAHKPNEMDLSGTWKIKYDNNQDYSDPKLNDQNWCLINVPNPKDRPTPSDTDKPSASCPKEAYPKSKMRNNTYWYRKTIKIDENFDLKEPSLFLGVIKEKAWIYWDGKQIGTFHFRFNNTLISLNLTKEQIKAGTHHLALKVQSGETNYPGLVHAFQRKVVLGEVLNDIEAGKEDMRSSLLEPSITLIVQVFSFLVLLILTIRSKGTSPEFKWLSIYFVGTIFYLSKQFSFNFIPETRWLMQTLAFNFMGISLIGYKLSRFNINQKLEILFKNTISLYGFFLCSTLILSAHFGYFTHPLMRTIDQGSALLPLVLFFALFLLPKDQNQVFKKNASTFFGGLSLISLFTIHLTLFMESFILKDQATFYHLGFLISSLTLVVIWSTIEHYTQTQTELAFFGRFIRKGLKQFLNTHQKEIDLDFKSFRGRQSAILKIDVVGHTETTYKMPYGVKRLFQDLWFTHIDHVVAPFTYLDKGEGDGSIYYFDHSKNSSGCKTAFLSTLQLARFSINEFDQNFNLQLNRLLNLTPELKTPMENYLKSYEERKGQPFTQRHTEVRFVLAYGFVDEGLWGLSSQSHYDVQGDLITIVSRLEKNANAFELVVTEEFFTELKKEWNEVAQFNWRQTEFDLKGIGLKKAYLLNLKEINLENLNLVA